jgi:hypothetical protein
MSKDEVHHVSLTERESQKAASFANEIEGNTFAKNGGFKNPSNGDIGEVLKPPARWQLLARQRGGRRRDAEQRTAGNPDHARNLRAAQLRRARLERARSSGCLCSQLLAECPPAPGEEYPRSNEAKLMALPPQPSMANPCERVPSNP